MHLHTYLACKCSKTYSFFIDFKRKVNHLRNFTKEMMVILLATHVASLNTEVDF